MPNLNINRQVKSTEEAYYNKQITSAQVVNGVTIPATWERVRNPDPIRSYSVLTEERSGSSIKGFNGPKRPFPAPVNAFTYRKWQLVNSLVQRSEYRPSQSGSMPIDTFYSSSYPGAHTQDVYPVLSASEWTAMVQEVGMKIRDKCRNQTFNAAVATAERNSTARTVGDAAKTIAKAVSAVRRGDVKGAAKALGVKPPRGHKRSPPAAVADAAAHHWLSLQYGWKPLLNDVYGAAEHLARSQNNVQLRRISAQKTLSRTIDTTTSYSSSTWDTYYDKHMLKTTETVTVRMGITVKQSSKALANAKELGITNPALVAWELVPFSFVADWFLPIGNFLGSLDATLGLEFVSGYQTTFRKRSGRFTRDMMGSKKDGHKTSYFGHNEWEGVTCLRAILSDFPPVSLPRPKNPLSVTHAVSAIALLHQLFRK